eukprot:g15519.t1
MSTSFSFTEKQRVPGTIVMQKLAGRNAADARLRGEVEELSKLYFQLCFGFLHVFLQYVSRGLDASAGSGNHLENVITDERTKVLVFELVQPFFQALQEESSFSGLFHEFPEVQQDVFGILSLSETFEEADADGLHLEVATTSIGSGVITSLDRRPGIQNTNFAKAVQRNTAAAGTSAARRERKKPRHGSSCAEGQPKVSFGSDRRRHYRRLREAVEEASADGGAPASTGDQTPTETLTERFRHFVSTRVKVSEEIQAAIRAPEAAIWAEIMLRCGSREPAMVDTTLLLKKLIARGIASVRSENWELCHNILRLMCRKNDDSEDDDFRNIQRVRDMMVRCDGVQLAAAVLDSPSPMKIYLAALEFGILLLEGGNVNAQEQFKAYFEENDDVHFFRNVSRFYSRVLNRLKSYKNLKAKLLAGTHQTPIKSSWRKTDATNIATMHEALLLLSNIQRLLQLLCEGHNSWMQDYLRHQSDNSETVSVVELTSDLVVRLTDAEA